MSLIALCDRIGLNIKQTVLDERKLAELLLSLSGKELSYVGEYILGAGGRKLPQDICSHASRTAAYFEDPHGLIVGQRFQCHGDCLLGKNIVDSIAGSILVEMFRDCEGALWEDRLKRIKFAFEHFG